MSDLPSRWPTLHEAEVAMREAESRGDKAAMHRYWTRRRRGRRPNTVWIFRCACGSPSLNDHHCPLCLALAQLETGQDESSVADLDFRYQLAERALDRLAAVVADLKRKQAA